MNSDAEPDPRVYFAAERTFLAWIRTGVALMGFGFVVARFGLFLGEMPGAGGSPPATTLSPWFGIALIALGVLLTAVSLATYIATVRRLNRGEPFVGRPSWLGIVVAVLLVSGGLLMTAYLILSS